jgi:hypothetical protein
VSILYNQNTKVSHTGNIWVVLETFLSCDFVKILNHIINKLIINRKSQFPAKIKKNTKQRFCIINNVLLKLDSCWLVLVKFDKRAVFNNNEDIPTTKVNIKKLLKKKRLIWLRSCCRITQ